MLSHVVEGTFTDVITDLEMERFSGLYSCAQCITGVHTRVKKADRS